MIIYTICGSMPLLAALAYLYRERQRLSFFIKYRVEGVIRGDSYWDQLMVMPLLGAFFVKSPVFMVHGVVT